MQIKEESSVLFLFGRHLFRIMFSLLYRWKVQGLGNIPKSGGAIIAANHMSVFDPPLAGSAIERPLYFMAKKELFDVPIFGWAIKQTNAFPVKRGLYNDMSALRHAFFLLKEGHLLLMFPEGTRSKNGQIGIARPGVGMVACNAQVPLIPVKITNTNTMLRFKQIRINYGEAIYPPKKFVKNDYLDLSKKVLDIIAAM
jgi:1-acyl-sn-glycerol-3-phosphate acyltransferase